MKITGLSSLMAAFSSPLASAGVDGHGHQQARHVQVEGLEGMEWVGPSWCPAPCGMRTTSGTLTWPPNM